MRAILFIQQHRAAGLVGKCLRQKFDLLFRKFGLPQNHPGNVSTRLRRIVPLYYRRQYRAYRGM